MTKHNRLFALVLAAALAWQTPASAHDGHAHTVMGTVTALDATHLALKTPSGEVLSIAIAAKTTAVRGKKKVSPRDVRVGERAVVDIGNGEDPLVARQIQLAAATAPRSAP